MEVNLCVICGHGLFTGGINEESGQDGNVVIKKEVEASSSSSSMNNDLEGGDVSFKSGGLHESLKDGSQEWVSVLRRVWTAEEKRIYQWFLKWFRLRLGKKERRRKVNSGWDGESGEDPFPFCGSCRMELLELLELQRMMEELEERINAGVASFKEKATACEDVFGEAGVYEKDIRYRAVRKQIVTDFKSRSSLKSNSEERRKSLRRTATTEAIILRQDCMSGSLGASQTPSVQQSVSDEFPENQQHLDETVKYETDIDSNDVAADEIEPVLHAETVRKSKRKLRERACQKKTQNNRVHELTSKLTENDDESSEFPFSDDMHDDKLEDEEESENGESSFSPLALTPASTKNSRKQKLNVSPENAANCGRKPKRTRKKVSVDLHENQRISDSSPEPTHSKRLRSIRNKTKDKDWVPVEVPSHEIQMDDSTDEDEADSDNDNIDLETGRRKRPRAKFDPKTKTLTYRNLVFHQLESPNLLQCSECGSEVKRHRISYHFVSQHTSMYACRLCDYRGGSKNNLEAHIACHHEGAPSHPKRIINCRICEKPIPLSRRKIHEWSHKNRQEREEAISCRSNDVPFTQLRKDHQCDQCGSAFSNGAKLQYHKDRLHGSQKVKESLLELCPQCGGTYADIRSHIRMQHEKDKLKMHTCLESDCGKSFKTLALLTRHKNAVHRKLRPFKCTMCPREFANRERFTNHMNLHNGVRPWRCDHCPMAFTSKPLLRRHIGCYHTPGVTPPKRKPFVRGPTMLGTDVRKKDLINEGKYLPPSALASWAAGREPTSHFPVEINSTEIASTKC